MEEDRIDIIVKEIMYWKQNKMLPDMYCDYLIALYTNGERGHDALTPKPKPFWEIVAILFALLMIPLSVLVIYFTKFMTGLQLGLLLLFIFFQIWSYFYLKKASGNLSHLGLTSLLGNLFLLFLWSGSYLSMNPWWISAIMGIQFFCWIVIGRKMRLKYLVWLGGIGIGLLVLYNVL